MASDPMQTALARIAEIRQRRLAREAAEASRLREAAEAAASAARAAAAVSAAERDEALRLLAGSPACIQARLWRDQSVAREAAAMARLADEVARLDLACDTHGAAVRAVARHETRTEAIAAHHRAAMRVEARRREDMAEADAPASGMARSGVDA